MVGGVAVELDKASMLWTPANAPTPAPLFVAVELQQVERAGRPVTVVRQACACSEELLAAAIPGAIVKDQAVAYDAEKGRVSLATRWRYRDLVLRVAGGAPPDATAAAACLAAALAPEAGAIVRADEDAAAWLTRVAWLRAVRPALDLPDFADADFQDIVATCAAGCTSRAEVLAKPKLPWLTARLTRAQTLAVDDEAPSHLQVPTGNRIRLDYAAANAETPPVLAVRLQELFGLAATPRLAGGAVPVLLHLQGPNYRVEQVTRDLASFWANTYPQVRKDLRGRYPKHSWPDDPLVAEPVAKGRPRQ
jgi:ATP-dependent helicase HrpB